ncbi:MAG: urea carboxylase-associated family protein [Oceanicaulis sp.]
MPRIPARSGTAFRLPKGAVLTVTDPEGEQVADLVAFAADDTREYLSSGRSIDFAERMFLTTGDTLYSNRSNPMLEIIEDEVGRHDFTLTPCSKATFERLYDDHPILPGCQGNLESALAPYGVGPDQIPIAFNVFMNVAYDPDTGACSVLPPKSKPGQSIRLRAATDLVIGLTACSADGSNNGDCTPIDWEIAEESALAAE